jgi:DNA-binding winged helix-turn-helix (wHTH) protein
MVHVDAIGSPHAGQTTSTGFSNVRWQFGGCVFDESTRQLLRDADVVHLSPKAFALLVLLVTRAPAAVSKDEILGVIWPEAHVSDASLTNVVAEIRRAIDDEARQPRFVRTVHGFGYAFCGELAVDGGDAGFPAWRAVVAGHPRILTNGPHLIGRDPTGTIAIDHTSVSRRHARLTVRDTVATIEDLGSRNGTFVNGQRIDRATALRDGDVVALGPVSIVIERMPAGGSTATHPQS